MQELKGIGVAMVTPYNKDLQIDFSALERLTHHLIDGGVDYLVVQGTTGESPVNTFEEKQAILDFVKEINAGRKPIVFGIGGNNTAEVAGEMQQFDLSGVTAILSTSPYYNKPSQEGIFRHYQFLDKESPLPIIIYNVPGRTGSNILPSTVMRIVENTNQIIGIKEAAGNIEQYMELLLRRPDDFLVISGDDALVLPAIACGANGVISVVGNAFPAIFGGMVHQALDGNFAEARKGHYRLLNLIHNLFVEGNPGGVKEVLKHLGICDNYVRLPLAPVSKELSEKLYHQIAEAGIQIPA